MYISNAFVFIAKLSKLLKLLQSAINEFSEYIKRVFWLTPGHHVTGVTHYKHAQIAHRFEVAYSLSIVAINVTLGIAVVADINPSGHLLKHLQDSRVIADDVHVSVIDQELDVKEIYDIQDRCHQ